MKRLNPLFGMLTVISLFSLPLAAEEHDHERREHGAHVHGTAKLKMAIEGQTVLIELETPAMNVVGFEHMPESDEQKQQVAEAVKALGDYRNLLQLKDGDCKQESAEVESPLKEEEQAKHEHADFEVGYRLSCKDASAVEGVEFTVFDHFPGFKKVELEWVSDAGQGAKEATKEHAYIELK